MTDTNPKSGQTVCTHGESPLFCQQCRLMKEGRFQEAADLSIRMMNPQYRGCVKFARCVLEARHDGDCEIMKDKDL